MRIIAVETEKHIRRDRNTKWRGGKGNAAEKSEWTEIRRRRMDQNHSIRTSLRDELDLIPFPVRRTFWSTPECIE